MAGLQDEAGHLVDAKGLPQRVGQHVEQVLPLGVDQEHGPGPERHLPGQDTAPPNTCVPMHRAQSTCVRQQEGPQETNTPEMTAATLLVGREKHFRKLTLRFSSVHGSEWSDPMRMTTETVQDKGSEAVSVWRPGWGVRQPDAVLQHLQVPRHVRQLPQLQRGLDVPLHVLRQVVHVRRHGGGSRLSRDFRWEVGHIEPDQIQKGWRKR